MSVAPAPKAKVFNSKYVSLFKYLIGKQGVRTKEAQEVGKRAVEFFRGADFSEFVISHADSIGKRFPSAVAGLPDLKTEEGVAALGLLLIKENFIARATHESLPGEDSNRRPKWPKKLTTRGEPQTEFSSVAFYIVTFEQSSNFNMVLLALLIVGVLVLVMFPAWPLKAKLISWYLSFALLCLLLGVTVLRVILFVLLWFCGVDFWLLPNMYDEYMGVLESFTPLYSLERRNDNWSMVGVRIFCAFVFASGCYQLSLTHSLADIGDFAKIALLDVVEWGEKKLTLGPEEPKYLSIEHFEKMTEEDDGKQHEKVVADLGLESSEDDIPIKKDEL